MTDFAALLESLVRHGVEFIVIGGFAATAHGSAFLTVDLDVVYRRTAENIARLAESLAPLKPYLRGAPGGLPFQLDEETIRRGLNSRSRRLRVMSICSVKPQAAESMRLALNQPAV